MIISSIVVKRIGLLFPRAGNGKRNRQQGYGRNIFQKIEMIKVQNLFQKKEIIKVQNIFWKIEMIKVQNIHIYG